MDELRRFKSLKFDLRTCSKENFGDVTRQNFGGNQRDELAGGHR